MAEDRETANEYRIYPEATQPTSNEKRSYPGHLDATEYPIFYCQENQRYEDHSVTGQMIHRLEIKQQRFERELRHSTALSPAEKATASKEYFDEQHIKAWDRPAMNLSKRLDREGDRDGSNLVHVPWERDDNER
jgi:hypothetical protein